jgi:hypothetical protein
LSASGLTTNVPGPSLPFAPFKRKAALGIPKIDRERPRWRRDAEFVKDVKQHPFRVATGSETLV